MDSASDISKGGWIDRFVPAPLRPYCRLARLDRPIGTWLLLLPCWWGVALANGTLVDRQWPELRLLALFAVGSLVMRGAGCTWNDLVDRDYDARVARTADRPLPSGAVSLRAAVTFLILQTIAGASRSPAIQFLHNRVGDRRDRSRRCLSIHETRDVLATSFSWAHV